MRWLFAISASMVLSASTDAQAVAPQQPAAATATPRSPAVAASVKPVSPPRTNPAPRPSSTTPAARGPVAPTNRTVQRPALPAASTARTARVAPVQGTTRPTVTTTAAQPTEYRRIYVPEKHGDRPIAWGMDGLDVPIDRYEYANYRLNYMASLSSALARPLNSMRLGNSYNIPIGAVFAPNPITGPQPYSLYTFTNNQGGLTSILYNKGTGGGVQLNQSGSVGHLYYGSLPAGVSQASTMAPSVSFGYGVGSLSGIGSSPTVGNQGPFGGNYTQSPGYAGNNPISPTVGMGVYGVSTSLQAPGFSVPR